MFHQQRQIKKAVISATLSVIILAYLNDFAQQKIGNFFAFVKLS